ncbi:MAG: protein serine/threonine phosphatase [Bacteroidetes bacterium]|jgi:serine phosphatase RsbU (regulator of sigma subunit)|nr:protein serine/threonine phosphatase [Bacteroidota bacterium]MDF2453125.1 protein serine/threonine phosphatase [Bacteroidota bacterium]
MFKYILLCFIPLSFFSQKNLNVDSLERELRNSKNDTNKINLLHKLIGASRENDLNKALKFALEEVKLSENLSFKKEISYYDLAEQYNSLANYKKSLETFYKAEQFAQTFQSPKKEQVLAEINTGLASVYSNLNNNDLAISKAENSLQYYNQLNDTTYIAITILNIGNYYYRKNAFDEALLKYRLAETLFKAHKDSMYLPDCYNNIGSILHQLKKYEEALSYYTKSYDQILRNTPDDTYSIAVALLNIGQCYQSSGDIRKGLEYTLKSMDLFEKIDDLVNLNNAYFNAAIMYQLLGDLKNSNLYYLNYAVLKDSISNRETRSAIHEMSIKYETRQKEKENSVLTLENKNKKQFIYFALGACALLLCLVFFIFKGYRTKQKANQELENKNSIINQQKTLVEKQKAIVEEQHQDITDSIKYAQRIQGAILPPKNMWEKMLPNSFVMYLPKDILSGDFYWIEETKDYIYVAAADCTGHGVPGALISIVNYNLLNKAVLEKDLATPSEILDAVNLWLTESLHQTYHESAVRDGMDVSLIAIHKHSNEVLFTGANNPIYHVSNGELNQIKGDKFPVGAFIEDKIQKFTTKRFTVEKGDSIYLFSDGFADQFGGDNGKKYKYAPFQQKLRSVASLSLREQQVILASEFANWKGNHEQVDDVLVIGIKIA